MSNRSRQTNLPSAAARLPLGDEKNPPIKRPKIVQAEGFFELETVTKITWKLNGQTRKF